MLKKKKICKNNHDGRTEPYRSSSSTRLWHRACFFSLVSQYLFSLFLSLRLPPPFNVVMATNVTVAPLQCCEQTQETRRSLTSSFFSSESTTIAQMLEVCLKLNIRCVSAYAFSVENFKWPEEEVEALVKLAEEKLLELCQHGWSCSLHFLFCSLSNSNRDLLDEHGVRLNVIGKIESYLNLFKSQ
jgi:undecaprenyl pyrophosphate synthase